MTYKVIDLCCGTGAFSYVFKKFNKKDKKIFDIVFANDFVEESEKIYKLNHPKDTFIKKDLLLIDTNDILKHDIMVAGFPCQPFSMAGEKKGFGDERSNIFWKLIDIMKIHKPKIVIFENVKNLYTHDKGNTYKIITQSIEDAGYKHASKILDTCKITSVPQHRERIYIVCFLDTNHYEKFDFPQYENTSPRPIKDFLSDQVQTKFYYTSKLKVFPEIQKTVTKHISENVVYQYRRTFVRENKSSVCPTLTANMGGGGHNVPLILDDTGIRKLTPKECFNLQGFPDDYQFPESLCDSKLYKLAGNAISIPVVELIIEEIYKSD